MRQFDIRHQQFDTQQNNHFTYRRCQHKQKILPSVKQVSVGNPLIYATRLAQDGWSKPMPHHSRQ